MIVVVTKNNGELDGTVFPEAGIYFAMYEDDDYGVVYVSELSGFEIEDLVVKKIDREFLPDGIGGGGKGLVIYDNGDTGSYEANMTYAEAKDALLNGCNAIKYYSEDGVISATCLTRFYIYSSRMELNFNGTPVEYYSDGSISGSSPS